MHWRRMSPLVGRASRPSPESLGRQSERGDGQDAHPTVGGPLPAEAGHCGPRLPSAGFSEQNPRTTGFLANCIVRRRVSRRDVP